MFANGFFNASLLMGLIVGTFAPATPAHAKALSLGVKIQQEFYRPLVPVTTNFRTCFKTDAKGIPVLAPCTTSSEPQRVPANDATPKPSESSPSGEQKPTQDKAPSDKR